MRRFVGGVLVTLLTMMVVGFVVIYAGWFPLGADNPPGALERAVAHLATDRHLARNAPAGGNPFAHDPDAEFWLITKHGYRLTGMPAWDGILSDDQIWKVIAFVKHTDKLPPDVQAAWQAAAASAK